MTTKDEKNQTRTTSQISFRSEELQALRTAFLGRTAAIVAIIPLVTILTPWPGPIFIYFLLFGFIFLGWASWNVAKASWSRPWHHYAFVFADFVLLTFTLVYPNPYVPIETPPQFVMRFGTFIYFFVLLAGLVYVYRPMLVLWGGISAAICWTAAVLWLLSLPQTVWMETEEQGVEHVLKLMSNPYFVDVGVRTQEIIVLLIVACLLGLAVARSRRIALKQANLARERENLGRYFPRKTAQMLADRKDPFSSPREHKAAVLFADLVAFTAWSERHSSTETIKMLQEVHGTLARVVFRNDGTLDKFIGDGVMATFGTPEPTERDAVNALAALLEMADAFEDWKRHDANPASRELSLAIGAHYGPVVIGNVGSAERLEFAVLGDTVNVASRLESANRQVGCRGLVSSDLMEAAMLQDPERASRYRERFDEHAPISLKGRSGRVGVLVLK